MKLSVLVVGGAGYIGSHVVKKLVKRGDCVTVFDNLSTGHRGAVVDAEFRKGDLLNRADVDRMFETLRCDVVMHFASSCYVGESVEEPQRYYRNNVVGTLNLLDAMLDAKVKRVVFSSSCAVYGAPLDVPVTESHPREPLSPYGRSKAIIENILEDYGNAYGLKSISLRYFNAAGADPEGTLGENHRPESHLVPRVLLEARRVMGGGAPEDTQLVVNGDDYETPDGTCIRDYVHVDDLASAHLAAAGRLMTRDDVGVEAINLGNGYGFSVKEIIEAGRRVTGMDIRCRIGPRRPGDPPRLVASFAKARDTLRWHPSYSNLHSIIGTAWEWHRRSYSSR